MIMVLHDINHARMYADDIVILKDKHVFEQGEPNTVLDVENLAKVFGVNALDCIKTVKIQKIK